MKRSINTIACILTAVCSTAFADSLPNPKLTPGATRTITVEEVCISGSSKKARYVTESAKKKVFAAYGIPGNHQGACGVTPEGCEIDHLISLELGGSNAAENLWPQPYGGIDGGWDAHKKDALENKLHALVCSGQLTLSNAQDAIAHDWISAYKQYVTAKKGK